MNRRQRREVIATIRATTKALSAARNAPYVYHVTLLGRLDDIAAKGLRPDQKTAAFPGFAKHRAGKVFFTDGAGVEWWFDRMSYGRGLYSPDDLVIVLRLKADQLRDADRDYLGSQNSRGLSYTAGQPIHPRRMEVWDGDRWVPLRQTSQAAFWLKVLENSRPFPQLSNWELEEYNPALEEVLNGLRTNPSSWRLYKDKFEKMLRTTVYEEGTFEPLRLRNAPTPTFYRDLRYDPSKSESSQHGKKRGFETSSLPASAISASRLAFPKKMRDRIFDDIRTNYATYIVKLVDKKIREAQAGMAAKGGSVKLPSVRIGPALSAELDIYSEGTRDSLEEEYNKGKINPDMYETIERFFRTYSNKDLQAVLQLGPNQEKQSRWDRDPWDWIIYPLENVVDLSESQSAVKSARRLIDIIKKVTKPVEAANSPKLAQEREKLQQKLEQWELRKKNLAPLWKLAKRKTITKWSTPVDLSDLPERYNLPAHPTEADRKHAATRWEKDVLGPELRLWMRADKRIKTFGGRYDFNGHIIEVVVPLSVPADMQQFERVMDKAGDTIEHELNHMVQWIGKAIHGPKYGTAYGPREALPGEKGVGRAPKEAFPRASKKERYYLDPMEFYPNLETAVFRFLRDIKDGDRVNNKAEFLAWVGQSRRFASKNGIHPRLTAPFFAALKKHDPKRYRKAMQEAWQRVRPHLDLTAPKVEKAPVSNVEKVAKSEVKLAVERAQKDVMSRRKHWRHDIEMPARYWAEGHINGLASVLKFASDKKGLSTSMAERVLQQASGDRDLTLPGTTPEEKAKIDALVKELTSQMWKVLTQEMLPNDSGSLGSYADLFENVSARMNRMLNGQEPGDEVFNMEAVRQLQSFKKAA